MNEAMRDIVKLVMDRVAAASVVWSVVGGLRRKETATEVEILSVPRYGPGKHKADLFMDSPVNLLDEALEQLCKEGIIGGDGGKFQILLLKMPLKVHRAKEHEFASKLVNLTGPKNYLYEVHTAAKAMFYQWIPDAGFRPVGSDSFKRPFVQPKSEAELFKFLRLPWTEPKERKWGTVFASKPSTDRPLTHAEFGEWVGKSKWTGSSHAGEPHQWTLRVMSESDDTFLRVIKMIQDFGYPGYYKGRQYRYLDLGEWFYFTQGYLWEQTQLINRKLRTGTEARDAHEWVRNPNPVKLLSVRTEQR